MWGTNRVDGPPQLSPVWYIYEEPHFYISITTNTAKYHNLKRDPRITICIDGDRSDVRTITVYGSVELLEPDAPRQDQMRWQIIRHYHTDEAEARRYYEEVRETPGALIIVTTQKIISQNFN